MSKFKLVVTFCICAFLAPAFAQSLAEKEKFAAEDKELSKAAEYASEQCKTTIKAKIDWSGFNIKEMANNSASGYCEEALSALRHVCGRSELAMKTVQDKVKSVTCKYSSPLAVSLKSGELIFSFSFNDSNLSEKVQTYLMDNL